MNQSSGVVDVCCCFGDSCQKSLSISEETLILQVVGGVTPLPLTPKAGTRSPLSHRQQGARTQSSTDKSAGLFLRFLNVEDDQIFNHIWSPISDRTEKYTGGQGLGEVLIRRFLAAFPDAFFRG